MLSVHKNNHFPKRIAISVAVAATFLAGYGSRRSYAGSCTGAADTFTCSGAAGADSTQSIFHNASTPLSITTNVGFGLNSSGDGISVLNYNGSVTFSDANNSAISASGNGVDVKNYGSSVNITTTGTVSGNTRGIRVRNLGAANFGNATSVTINANNVSSNYIGIDTNNTGTSATNITTTGTVTGAYGGSGGYGIRATNGATATDMTINSNIVNADTGIRTNNYGKGATSITTTGTVTGTNGSGIDARNYGIANSGNTTDLTINTAAVTGSDDGISAFNGGTGATSVTSTGIVTGTNNYGIKASNAATGTDVTINSTSVSGARGVGIKNYGTGATSLTSTGTVTGTNNYGIFSYIGTTANSLTINTVAVTGATVGILSQNKGLGATSITSTGTVTGTTNYGIRVLNYSTTTGLTINAAAVTSGGKGIYAKNNGSGATSITSTGTVTGTSGNGIFVYNDLNANGITINSAAVSGGASGIRAFNQGKGAISITSTGTVTGTNYYGIYANNNQSTGTTLSVNAAAVSGLTGIKAFNFGGGATSITSTGAVTGTNGNGIEAYHKAGFTNLTIDVGAALSGTNRGIAAFNNGKGAATNITVNGAVTGGTGQGIYTSSSDGSSTITLNTGGSVSATSGNAILMSGKGANSVTVNNGASVTGSVDLGGGAGTMTLNGGTWSVANGFALNLNGNFINTNNSTINLQNNAVDAPATITGNYTGGGQLQLDANFATNTADKLMIAGNVLAGGTSVSVNDISTGPATGAGITLVSVGGTTTAGDFTLAAPVARGAFNYNRLALVGKDWVLQSLSTSTPAAGGTPSVTSTPAVAFTPVAASFETLGQSMLTLANLPTLIERITGRIGGLNLNNGANSGDDTKAVTPVWFRLGGGYRDIDSASSTTGASFMTKQWQTQVGIDIPVLENAFGRFVAGVNAGYNVASTDVTSTAGKSNLDTKGYSLGVSGTWYSLNNLYVDLQLQRGWYDTDLSAGGVGAGKVKGVGSNGYSTSVEVGKAFPLNATLDITPQVQLTYATLDTDNFTGANAEIVKLSTSKSLRARLGSVLKKRFTEDGSSNGFVLANVTREFEDKTQVNVSGTQLTNAVDRWTGQLGLGLSHAWTKGLMSYEVSGVAALSTSLNNLGNSTAAQGQLNFRVNF